MKKIFLFSLVLAMCLSTGYAQNLKQKNSTPIQMSNIPSITTLGGDNIMTFLPQDFESTTFPPAGWTNAGPNMWSRSTDASGYGIGTASALADFYSISSGGQLNLITPTFLPSLAGDSLKFDHAYATYQTEVDQLQVYTSTNNGASWTLLITLLGGVNGPLVTAPPTTGTFVPTASQWATKKYSIPTGTNKVKFTGVSAYGNELYIDNILIGTPYSIDVSVSSIDAPKPNISPGTVAPKVTVKNWGLTTQSFPVTVTISPGGYTSTQNVTNLVPGGTQQITFADWTPTIGSYNVVAVSQLSTDMNMSNDTTKLFTVASNINRSVLLEYCTGTWCVWCPCGASTAHTLETTYPSLVVLAYHGGSGDPWIVYNGSGIISALSFAGYPTGIADRQNAAGDYTTFTGFVNNRYTNSTTTPININIQSQDYNSTTGLLSVTTNITSICNLPDTYSVSYVIMENNLVFNQQGNGTCPGSATFVHNHVVRNMVNNQNGEIVNQSPWTAGQTIQKSFSTTIPSNWIAANCQLVIFVYKGTSANNSAEVQNVIKTGVTTTGIIGINSEIPQKFELSQNYPNPFNPTTNIKFALPKSGTTTMKIYDIMGREVMTMFSGFMNAGYYNADLDASKLASGIYFYKLESGDFKEVKKMTVIK